jgi:hypothetical protein
MMQERRVGDQAVKRKLCGGNPFWLTGVDAPITKKHISKYLKISEKIS